MALRIAVLAVLLAAPTSAWAQCETWWNLLQNPPSEADPLAHFLQRVDEAARTVDLPAPETPPTEYSELERTIISTLEQIEDAACGDARLLGVSLEGGLPEPGFTSGRETSYAIALDVLQRYNYTLLDEDPISDAGDVEWDLEDNVVVQWDAEELARVRVVLDTFEPWFGDLDLKAIIRDDWGQFRTPDGPHLFGTGGTYWMKQELFGDESPKELRIYNGPSDSGCYEKFLIHELMHAWLEKHHDVQSDFDRRVGWSRRVSDKPSTTRYVDCKGNEYPLLNTQWIKPQRSNVAEPQYHDVNAFEDSAEQMSYRIIGAAAETLARKDGNEPCLDFLGHDTPDPEAVVDEFVQAHFPENQFLRTSPWQGIRMGSSSTDALIEASGTDWTQTGASLVKKIGGDVIDEVVVRTHRDRVMSIANIYTSGSGPTAGELIATYGPPSRHEGDRLIWDDRLLSATLDGRHATRTTYGLWGFH